MAPSTHLRFVCIAIALIIVEGQNVFENTAGSCRYDRRTTGKKDKVDRFLTFSGETKRILGKRKGLELYVNFCGPIGNVPGCDPEAYACLKRPSKTIGNVAKSFQYITVDEEQRVFRSTGGARCDDNENYTVTVEFDSTKLNSSVYVDECDIIVKMLGPNAKPPCTTRVDGLLIDLQPLRRLPERKYFVGNDTYASTFCRSAPSCGSDVYSSCKLPGDGAPKPQSEVQYEVVAYDRRRNQLQIQRRLGYGSSRTRTEVNLRCMWDVEFGAMRQIGNNKFEVETKYGCLKMPLNCTVLDIQGFVYDLRSLDRPEGWEVRNATNLRINVCGPLMQEKPNACSDIYAQVCQQKGNKFLSYGATSSSIVEANDVLHLDFRDGSRCPNRTSELLVTRIRFECAAMEEKPTVVDEVNCTLHVVWRTPAACAIANADRRSTSLHSTYNSTTNCTVREDGTSYDLTPLVRNDGNYRVPGPDGEEYLVNVCRSLIVDHDNYMCYGKAACMLNNTEPNFKYRYVGLGTVQGPSIVDGSVVLEYEDGYSTKYFCMRKMIVHFECSAVEKGPVFWRREKCVHELKWQTRHACPGNVAPKSRSVRCISHSNALVTFNFENNTKKEVAIVHKSKTYTFSLCRTNYTVSDNGIQKTEAATVELKYINCTYMLVYNLSGTDCKEGNLSQLTVLLTCGHGVRANDHYNRLGWQGCGYFLEFVSDEACKTMLNVSTPSCDLPTSKKMEDSSERLQQITNYTVETSPKNTKASTEKPYRNRNCSVGVESVKQFPLERLDFAVVRRSKDNYTVGFDRCTSGFVCRNNRSIATVNSECPNAEYDVVASTVTLRFVGPTCGHGRFRTSVLVKCKEDDGDIPTITSETKCSVEITVPVHEICNVLTLSSTSNPTTASAGIVAGIVLLLVSIVIILAYMYKKRWISTRYSQICVDKQKTRVYEKDTLC